MSHRILIEFEFNTTNSLEAAYKQGLDICQLVRSWYGAEGSIESFYEILMVGEESTVPTEKETAKDKGTEPEE